MKQLQHFGIKSRIIRGDTKSYNSIYTRDNEECKNCGSKNGLEFIEVDNYGKRIHLCKNCLSKRANQLKLK